MKDHTDKPWFSRAEKVDDHTVRYTVAGTGRTVDVPAGNTWDDLMPGVGLTVPDGSE